MNRSTLVGVIAGAAIATATAGIAGYALMDEEQPGRDSVAQTCYEMDVESAAAPKDEKRVAGTVIGALLGGAVGNDIGDSDATRIAGAAAGAYAGNQAQKKYQENRTETNVETVCEPAGS